MEESMSDYKDRVVVMKKIMEKFVLDSILKNFEEYGLKAKIIYEDKNITLEIRPSFIRGYLIVTISQYLTKDLIKAEIINEFTFLISISKEIDDIVDKINKGIKFLIENTFVSIPIEKQI